MCLSVRVICVQKSEEGFRSFRARITGNCELSNVGRFGGPKYGHLVEQ